MSIIDWSRRRGGGAPITNVIGGQNLGASVTPSSTSSDISYRVEMRDIDGLAGAWTNVTADVLMPKGMQWVRGQSDITPSTRLAANGSFEFYLNNAAGPGGNSGNKQGYYSPNNANCRSGFHFATPATPVRVIAVQDGLDYPQWSGWCYRIVPRTGRYREQYTYVLARDTMGVLTDVDVVLAAQIAQTEVQCITAVLAACDAGSQPLATSFDTATDTLPYAFYDSGGQVKAFTLIDKATCSSQGTTFVKGDGTLRYMNRHTLALRTSQAAFIDEMHDLDAPSTLDNVYDRVQTRIAPPRVDPASTVEVAKTLSRVQVPGLGTATVWLSYQDPTNTLRAIGAKEFVNGVGTPIPYAATSALDASDLTAFLNSDGTGTDLSAFVSATVTCFADRAKFVFSNSGPLTMWATGRVTGKGIYSDTEQTFEKYVAQPYSDRLLDIDLCYQPDGTVAQAYAEYLFSLTSSLTKQGGTMTLAARETPDKARQGVSREIGDVITVQETVSGMNADFSIVQIRCVVGPTNMPIYQWLLAPAVLNYAFIFDDVSRGLFDTSRLGWA